MGVFWLVVAGLFYPVTGENAEQRPPESIHSSGSTWETVKQINRINILLPTNMEVPLFVEKHCVSRDSSGHSPLP